MLILYNPPSSPQKKPILPLSLLSLAAVLEGKHPYRIVDGNLEARPLDALRASIREGNARVLAVTVMPGPQLSDAVPACRQLKREFPELLIVWGGYFPTQHPEACLRSQFVDYVVRGHGELVFRQLVENLEQGDAQVDARGVSHRSPGGEIVNGGLAEMADPAQLPEFPYHQLEMDRYPRHTFLGRRTLSHHSSYGCPFVCNFCAVVNLAQGRWLAQSAPRVAGTVQRLSRDYGADAIEFQDNNFFVSEARVVDFAERIRGLGIGWWGEARIDTLLKYSDASWELMRKAGLRMVFLGAESASDEVLARMDKGGTASAQKTLQIAEQAARFDIVPEFSFMVGNPPDPEADADATLEFIRKVKKVNPRSEIILYLYTPVPLTGTLYDAARTEGFDFPETLDEWVSEGWLAFAQRRSSQLPWVRPSTRRRLHDFEHVLNAYYPTSTDPRLTGLKRLLLRACATWRYHLQLYALPWELKLMQRLFHYQRPETAGF